jgi:glycosyltransferase involved in cell wall biosynthesis
MIYLTYNDAPSGVYSSQVNDVCNYLNESAGAGIRLVAFISVRSFRKNRKKIKNEVANALVLPALPMANRWRFSSLVFTVVCLLLGEKSVIARNVLAAKIALFAKKCGVIRRVCFDGRGAIAAEWREYDVVHYDNLKKGISRWEREAVNDSDFRISVSSMLAEWWRSEYQYAKNDHVVIPCTLQRSFRLELPSPDHLAGLKSRAGYHPGDIILIYSGSVSGWQSFGLLRNFLDTVLRSGKQYKLIFLSPPDDAIDTLMNTFPGQVSRKWLSHREVQETLFVGDYGILYREQTVTNEVAAPTKFAEYLSAGLPVIISGHVGDYSEFTQRHQCGYVIREGSGLLPPATTYEQRKKMIALAAAHFTKDAYRDQYDKMLQAMNPRV